MSIQIGVPMIDSNLGHESQGGEIVWRVHPEIEYTITMTDQSGDEPVREIVVLPVQREHQIEFTLFQIFALRDRLSDELGANYIDISNAQRELRRLGHIE